MTADVYDLLPELVEISEPDAALPGQFVATLSSRDKEEYATPPVYVVLSATYTNEVAVSDALAPPRPAPRERPGLRW